MSLYQFETDQFGISEQGIHLLRSGNNYQTFEFEEIGEMTIEKGNQIANWLLSLTFGIVLILVGLYVAYTVLAEYFFYDRVHTFYVEQFLFPVFPLFVGSYLVYMASRIGLVLSIEVNGKTRKLPIENLRKQNKIEELMTFFYEHNLTKHKFKSDC